MSEDKYGRVSSTLNLKFTLKTVRSLEFQFLLSSIPFEVGEAKHLTECLALSGRVQRNVANRSAAAQHLIGACADQPDLQS